MRRTVGPDGSGCDDDVTAGKAAAAGSHAVLILPVPGPVLSRTSVLPIDYSFLQSSYLHTYCELEATSGSRVMPWSCYYVSNSSRTTMRMSNISVQSMMLMLILISDVVISQSRG